jgi:hypothetical protein
MKIEIEGNPGTGNTFQEINIGHVENYNPAATTVINNNYGTREKKSGGKHQASADMVDITPIRAEILIYVDKLRIYVAKDWRKRYGEMWSGLVDLEKVKALIYNSGKQEGTNFNRTLVAKIIHHLYDRGIYSKLNACAFAYSLEDNKDHSVRNAFRDLPSAEICEHINRYLENFVL